MKLSYDSGINGDYTAFSERDEIVLLADGQYQQRASSSTNGDNTDRGHWTFTQDGHAYSHDL